ncbi:MAG: YihY/virulence factor BrkB family protein [Pseudomonadota bacterium]
MKGILSVFWNASIRLVYDGGLANAGNVALSLLLSIFPFMLLIAVLVNIWGEPELLEQILELVFSHWPAGSAAPIAAEMKVVLGQAGGELISINTLIALFLATNGVESARDGLNRAYKLTERRNFMWRRLQGTFFVFVGALSLILTAFILIGTPIAWNFIVTRIDELEPLGFSVVLIQYGLAFGILIIILYCFHYFLPCGRKKIKEIRWGIWITIAGILLGSKAFGFYLTSFADYTAIYAGLAGIMIVIVYLYYLSVLILFGAEFNASLAEYRKASLSA